MNSSLPKRLKTVDKIDPATRRNMIEEFWASLGNAPLGRGLPRVENQFWHPPDNRAIHIKVPDLLFGGGKILKAPLNGHG